uniref:Uncharacterized protein n=1 Tax=Arundo donax TaxID=35708 RepID=A0A0A9FLP9_ARUDO
MYVNFTREPFLFPQEQNSRNPKRSPPSYILYNIRKTFARAIYNTQTVVR